MAARTKFKLGDTFDVSDQLVMTIDGVPVTDFTGMTGTSQIRGTDDTLIATIVFTWLDTAQGLYRTRFVGSTQAWPAGEALHDVQLTTAGGDVVSTETESITFVRDVTRAVGP
jgi:hypothetical protein